MDRLGHLREVRPLLQAGTGIGVDAVGTLLRVGDREGDQRLLPLGQLPRPEHLRVVIEEFPRQLRRLLADLLEGVDEVVLCGFGEPLRDLDRVMGIAEAGKKAGWRVRANTSGLANQIHERDVTKELAGVVDEIVVLYYGTTHSHHDRIVMSGNNQNFEIMKDFTRCSVLARIDTVCEFIAVPKFNPEACREFAREVGAQYDIRMYRS